MESVSCATDPEQSAFSYSIIEECEPIIKEEQWDELDCGLSEAAVAESLYAEHEIKQEMVLGPDLVQMQDIAFPMASVLKKIKEEPCQVKPRSGAATAVECTRTNPHKGPLCSTSPNKQLKLKSCSVRLERFPIEEIPACRTCHKTFDCRLRLKNHNCTNEVEKSFFKEGCYMGVKFYTCNICDIKIASESQLNRHIWIHTGETLFECDLCQKLFTRGIDLSRHIVSSHSYRIKSHTRYMCPICKRKFILETTLLSHIPTHTKVKQFSCGICRKKFYFDYNFHKHMKCHTSVKLYSCDICEKNFAWENALMEHVKIHSTKKP